jgi:hypothetical protein
MYVANMRAAQAKERALNRILPQLQESFEDALNAGTLLELGPGNLAKLEEILAEELDGVLA